MKGFSRAQAEYESRMPDGHATLSGVIEIHLTKGIYDGQEVTVDVELSPSDELIIFEAALTETELEIDTDEITSRDRDRIADKLIEYKQIESD